MPMPRGTASPDEIRDTVTVLTFDLYGTVVGRTLSVSGRAGIHYDETVFPYGGNVSGIVLVE